MINLNYRIKSWLLWRVFYPLWGGTACKIGKHIDKDYLDNTNSNFCPGCKKQLNLNIYNEYRIFTHDGTFEEIVIALNGYHAQSFFTYKYHRDNLKVDYIKPMNGLLREEWEIKMKPFLSGLSKSKN